MTSERPSDRQRLGRSLLVGVALAGAAYGYGLLSSRYHLPPKPQIIRLGRALGWIEPRLTERLVTTSAVQIEALQSLPYVDGTVDLEREANGVVVHDRRRAFPGLNLYNSRPRAEAQLVDMEGRVVHQWRHPGEAWHHTELLPDGDLLVVAEYVEVLRLDRDSRLKWRTPLRAHHDLWVAGDEVFVLVNEQRLDPRFHAETPIVEDFVAVLDAASGRELRRHSVLELLLGSPHAYLAVALPPGLPLSQEPKDRGGIHVTHTNHVEIFDGRLAARSPIFAKGNVLLSLREQCAVLIADPGLRQVLWLWGPSNLLYQHHPTLLENGNLLLFDNRGLHSRAVELDPLTRQIVWQYGPVDGFQSGRRGSVQRLPNGNTLITESDRGYAFEVTPAGEVVWRFANPDIRASGLREAIWRVTRFPRGSLPFLTDGGARQD